MNKSKKAGWVKEDKEQGSNTRFCKRANAVHWSFWKLLLVSVVAETAGAWMHEMHEASMIIFLLLLGVLVLDIVSFVQHCELHS